MKKLISIVLTFATVFLCLVSCATVTNDDRLSTNITVTSSDGENAARWLDERLGDSLTDRVVLGTESDGYGVDVSELEDDGYIIRSLGDEVVLFARTTDGLDRAVRKYAKTVESGEEIGNVTYHEGYRIKEIRLAGRDISEYTLYCGDDKNLKAAADELAVRIKQACGAELQVSTADTPAIPYISLCYVHDEELGPVGYRWSVDEGGLTIQCSDNYKLQSGKVAVRRFLEKNLDWFGLSGFFESLTPADLVELKVGQSGGEPPAFKWMNLHSNPYNRFETLDNQPVGSGPWIRAMHGIYLNKFGTEYSGSNWEKDQPCYLDEYFYEESYADVIAYVESNLDAGMVIGETFFIVDIAMPDNSNWCTCAECMEMLSAEKSYAGSVLTWSNRIAEEVDSLYPGLTYTVFAYGGSNKLPKTVRPSPLLTITFCFDGNCSLHPLDGSGCSDDSKFIASDRRNSVMAAQLKEWLEVTPNVITWHYNILNGYFTPNVIHNVWDDIHFVSGLGAIGMYWEHEMGEADTGWVASWLATELAWNIDMTRDEYDALYDRIVSTIYGDAGPLIREYADICSKIHMTSPCADCWGWGYGIARTFNEKLWEYYFDTLFEIIEEARLLPDNAVQQRRVDFLSCACIYQGTMGSYFNAYNNYDDERIAELCRRYDLIDERMSTYGIDITESAVMTLFAPLKIARNLEVQAWAMERLDVHSIETLTPTAPTREIPDWVAEILGDG